MSVSDVDPAEIARAFHETYERLAPRFGYKTRRASAVPWEDVPEPNRALMVAVAGEMAQQFGRPFTAERDALRSILRRLVEFGSGDVIDDVLYLSPQEYDEGVKAEGLTSAEVAVLADLVSPERFRPTVVDEAGPDPSFLSGELAVLTDVSMMRWVVAMGWDGAVDIHCNIGRAEMARQLRYVADHLDLKETDRG